MPTSQAGRQSILREMCAKYFPESNETSEPYPKMWSSDKQHYLVCLIPKVEHHLRFH